MTSPPELGEVLAVCLSRDRQFSKTPCDFIDVIAGYGVRGDIHAGAKVRHRSRMRTDPYQPNLRQVHLIPGELIDELDRKGYELNPGNLGENIVTRGLDLTAFGRDTLLRIGPRVVLSVTGLRNPCQQIEEFAPGLLEEVAPHTPRGRECRVGIMTVVLAGGIVRPGDNIEAERPEGLHVPLRIV